MLRNKSKILTFIVVNKSDMNKKIKKLLHLITMCAALAAVAVFAVIHALTALNTQYGTLVMAAYVLMFIWAGCRVVVLAKEYKELQ